jgi:2,4-dienoyl-CoA reductase-like NADH-dependent reductase (Old Yellow Enzyme family)
MNLFSPIKVGSIELKKRIVMAPIGGHGYCPDGKERRQTSIEVLYDRITETTIIFFKMDQSPTPALNSNYLRF